MNSTESIRVVSLFSGAGGADLGMEQAGLKVVFANDNDGPSAETYEHNFGRPVWPSAIQYLPADCVPDCDVIIGGPPCQSFSTARTTAGETLQTATGLANVVEMKRIVYAKKPKIFVCENIPAIIDNNCLIHAYQEFKYWTGYDVQCFRLNAEDFGVPQRRERLFFVGTRMANSSGELAIHFAQPKGTHWRKLYSGIAEYLGLEPAGWFLKRANGRERVSAIGEAFYTITTADNSVWRWSDLHSKSLMTAVRELVGIKQRYLTVREKAWLQGFPPDFEFLGNQVQTCRMIGNAWCVNVARGIGMEIKRCLQSTMHIV